MVINIDFDRLQLAINFESAFKRQPDLGGISALLASREVGVVQMCIRALTSVGHVVLKIH